MIEKLNEHLEICLSKKKAKKNSEWYGKYSERKAFIRTMVLVKNEGLLGKLDPKFKGSFIVHEKSRHGNYILKDATGEIVEFSIPLKKFKIIPYDKEK